MSNYYQSTRGGYKVQWLVLHSTEGSKNAALAWWTVGAQSPGQGSSAHYLVTSGGSVISVVPESMVAWSVGGSRLLGVTHEVVNGVSVENLVSLSIELEYPASPSSPPWPEAQWGAAVTLVKDIVTRYGIPRKHVVRHLDIDPKNRSDPRNFDWVGFVNAVFAPAQREGLPTDETATDAATLAQKCRFWVEEAIRQRNAGDAAYADRIMYSLVKLNNGLMYRLEKVLHDSKS